MLHAFEVVHSSAALRPHSAHESACKHIFLSKPTLLPCNPRHSRARALSAPGTSPVRTERAVELGRDPRATFLGVRGRRALRGRQVRHNRAPAAAGRRVRARGVDVVRPAPAARDTESGAALLAEPGQEALQPAAPRRSPWRTSACCQLRRGSGAADSAGVGGSNSLTAPEVSALW